MTIMPQPIEDEEQGPDTTRRFTIEHPVPAADVTSELPKIPGRGQYGEAARIERLDWIAGRSGATLEALRTTRLLPERLVSNIENMIGAIEVPVGLAGPLLFNGHRTHGVVYAPLATTEGALVASATRGATAVSRAGGLSSRVLGQRMMRVPMFALSSFTGALRFVNWIRDHTAELRAQVRHVSQHADLVTIDPVVIGRMVHVRFTYETGDAAGQNMTTACTWHACQWLMRELRDNADIEFENFIIEANMSGDKKVNYQSFIAGRGIRVVAECEISREVMEQVLKVTPEQLLRCNAGIIAGSIQAGTIGYNINVANTIAAIFTATGQDIACVHESSIAQLHLDATDVGVHASITLPGLTIGTVGGGTHLPGQHALLEMMGCAGVGKVERFAEIIAGFALALDLSTLAAVASGEFASAHERLGRNRPIKWFARDDLSTSFVEDGLRESFHDPALEVRALEMQNHEMGSSIVTELSGRKVKKLVGMFSLRAEHVDGRGVSGTTELIAKVKPLDLEVMLMVQGLASMCGPRLSAAHQRFRDRTGFAGCHVRELAVYSQTDRRFTRHVPRLYRAFRDDSREAYVLLLERLHDMALIDAADDIRGWSESRIVAALKGIGAIHGIWYGREEDLLAQPWLGPVQTANTMKEATELWAALAEHAAAEFPELYSGRLAERHRLLVNSIGDWWPELEALPRTLIHNDFNPRNAAIRNTADGPRLCAYDWELATLQVPQHDLAELLAFVLTPDVSAATVEHFIGVHREALELSVGHAIDARQWRAGYALSLRDLLINRFALYLMGHTFRHYGFIERAIRTLDRLLDIEAERGTVA